MSHSGSPLCQERGLGACECASALVAVKVVRPVGRSILTVKSISVVCDGGCRQVIGHRGCSAPLRKCPYRTIPRVSSGATVAAEKVGAAAGTGVRLTSSIPPRRAWPELLAARAEVASLSTPRRQLSSRCCETPSRWRGGHDAESADTLNKVASAAAVGIGLPSLGLAYYGADRLFVLIQLASSLCSA